MRWLRWLGAIALVLGVVLLYLAGMVDAGRPVRVPDQELTAYSAAGPYAVGVRDLDPVGEDGPAVAVWYPATDSNGGQPVANPYELRIAGPLGTTTIGTAQGVAHRDAPPEASAGPAPLVVLSPGFAIGASSYAWLAEHLASHGFVVVSYDTDETLMSAMNGLWRSAVERPRILHAMLDHIGERAADGGPLDGLVDTDTVAVVGHSYGGYTALVAGGARLDAASFERRCSSAAADESGAWLCDVLVPHLSEMAELADVDAAGGRWPDWSHPSVRAVVSLAGDAYLFGERGLAELRVPVLAIGGTADTDTPYDWGTRPTYAFAASPRKARLTLGDAGHMIFTARCDRIRRIMDLVPNEFCRDEVWDRDRAHQLVAHHTTAFLLAELRDEPPAVDVVAATGSATGGDATYDATGYRPDADDDPTGRGRRSRDHDRRPGA